MAVPEFYSGKILYPAIAVLLSLSALFGLAILPRLAPSNGLVGKAAPDATMPVVANGDLGSRMQIAKFRGQPMLLDFWASWCGPCAVEAPIVDRIARRYEKKGLVVMGVNVDDPPEVVRSYAAKKGLSYPLVTDGNGDAQREFGVHQLPSLIVIDKQGQVTQFAVGVVDESELDEMVAAVM